MRSLALLLGTAFLALACTPTRVTTVTNQGLLAGSSSSSSSSGGSSSGTGTSGGSVTLAWAAGAGTPTGYIIEQSTDQNTYTTAATVGGGTTSATVSGLTHGQTYYFRIHAYNATGNSSVSSVISATIPN